VEQSGAFDEGRVRRLLAGTGADIDEALGLIEAHLRDRLCNWLRGLFPGLTAEDLADAWQETLVGVLRAARARRFDPARPLAPWLGQIAYARTADVLRRATAYGRAVAAAGDRARRQAACRDRCGARDPEDVLLRELAALLDEAGAVLLSDWQRLVFRVFREHHPDSLRAEVLWREVSRVAPGRTPGAVRRAMQEVRAKFRPFLRGKGYGPGPGGEP
jgi:DNA-directed RNA polymerase specialized sigma24 family protein